MIAAEIAAVHAKSKKRYGSHRPPQAARRVCCRSTHPLTRSARPRSHQLAAALEFQHASGRRLKSINCTQCTFTGRCTSVIVRTAEPPGYE